MKTIRIRVFGIVQGVGMRPFVSRLASELGLRGSVSNKGSFVEICLQGDPAAVKLFQNSLRQSPPERAVVLRIESSEIDSGFFRDFSIIESEKSSGPVLVPPDIAICGDCRREMYDRENRRYLHPFINCTACGPRMTILRGMPYDRERTSMAGFPMCDKCAGEYASLKDRRYDAQPICCNGCGPQVYLAGEPDVRGMEAVRRTRRVLHRGGIAAIKGIGGFHLCCDAHDEEAVRTLRERKSRPMKPFAVMAADLDTAGRYCEIDADAAALLDGPQKPIVLCRKRVPADAGPGAASGEDFIERPALAESVAPDNPVLGVMLPYAPLQLLLFDDPEDGESGHLDVLVMTSGNLGGAPICIDDAQALEQLGGMCDIILSHERDILVRADDSVADAAGSGPFLVRRSRGYAPLPIDVCAGWRGRVLAVGGELKNAFCIGRDDYFYLSPHVGDLSDMRGLDALSGTISHFLDLLEASPDAVACDSHPGYRSSDFAHSLGIPVYDVQHHYAHILSCMAENGMTDSRVIGVAFDGTGYGADGTIWGGEFLIADIGGYGRAGSLRPFYHIGGDAASREGWRVAVSMLAEIYGPDLAVESASLLGLCAGEDAARLLRVRDALIRDGRILGASPVRSTSAGRLFDAAAALLGIRTASTFEGEAAAALQYTAQDYAASTDADYHARPCPEMPVIESGGFFTLDYGPVIEYIVRSRLAGVPARGIAYDFHRALAAGAARVCGLLRGRYGHDVVALSGGCFCNRLLRDLLSECLRGDGFKVITHREVPANDGGIALGQAVYLMNLLGRGGRSPAAGREMRGRQGGVPAERT